jgi:hypothetical protein
MRVEAGAGNQHRRGRNLHGWQLMSSEKLKVFRLLGNWLSEFRLYQRDKDGKTEGDSEAERPFNGLHEIFRNVGA